MKRAKMDPRQWLDVRGLLNRLMSIIAFVAIPHQSVIWLHRRRGVHIGRDYGMRDQIRRASVSIMNNIAEGFERGSNKDFAKFMFIARGSAAEVRSMLYVALDQGYITESQFAEVSASCVRVSQLCWGLIKHLQKSSGWRTGLSITLMMCLGGW